MFTTEEVRKMRLAYDGNFSQLYPHLATQLKRYPDEALPFRGEFLFFEDLYMLIRETISDRELKGEIVDIGCQYGIQSVLFEGTSYVGMDVYDNEEYFFGHEREDVRYVVGRFPDSLDVDLEDKVILSIMSLGFFERDRESKKELSQEQLRQIQVLKKAKYLFIRSTDIYEQELAKHFAYVEALETELDENCSWKVMFMTNEPTWEGKKPKIC